MSARPQPEDRWQSEPSPFAIECREHGKVYGTHGEALWAMTRPEQFLVCPKCDAVCHWHEETEMTEMTVPKVAAPQGEFMSGMKYGVPMKLLESLGFKRR
jgi:hypothetical protein